jgi:hypothetical protein
MSSSAHADVIALPVNPGVPRAGTSTWHHDISAQLSTARIDGIAVPHGVERRGRS